VGFVVDKVALGQVFSDLVVYGVCEVGARVGGEEEVEMGCVRLWWEGDGFVVVLRRIPTKNFI
jgi:hypothetical protein